MPCGRFGGGGGGGGGGHVPLLPPPPFGPALLSLTCTGKSVPAHSFILSFHLFCCQPLLLFPFSVSGRARSPWANVLCIT